MDLRRINEILEAYLFEDIEDEDVKQEIQERIAGLSDDPEVIVNITTIDSEHEGIMAEVTEFGVFTEYVMSAELIDEKEDEEEE